jgi:hypothetical protein
LPSWQNTLRVTEPSTSAIHGFVSRISLPMVRSILALVPVQVPQVLYSRYVWLCEKEDSLRAEGLALSAVMPSWHVCAPSHGFARRLPSGSPFQIIAPIVAKIWLTKLFKSLRFCIVGMFGCVKRRILCGRRDLNPHASRRQNLNLVRLPISPRPQLFV